MVSYLTKSDASEGFNQVINFLNGSYIKYSLTINPNIYVSCIKQFWNTVVIKQDNGVTRLQALVNKKKVVITEAGIREVLRLDDAEGVDCLPTKRYLQSWHAWSMSAKRTLWHEFSSAIASAVICLSTGHHKHQVLLEEDLMESQQLVVELEVKVVVVAEVIVMECVAPGMLMEDLEVVVVVE
uniref:Xylulose kinase-1 n=1 Tax=Tanacetum cinerariifolium TaxID=118510 RepID=A0A699KDV0_TANCI|nr:xylulose kinase-1 [Tanacetum cinerariifolium]